MFEPDPKARADLKPGTLYAITGESGWIYYGQVTPDKSVGFLRRRDREVVDWTAIFASPVMAVVSVVHPSIGRALRSGRWKRLGCFQLHDSLTRHRSIVIWPVGTLTVEVFGSDGEWKTRVDDPAIQSFEQASAWDAEEHIPGRLTADFGAEPADWHIGGPIWRARRVKEELARRFPDAPWHALPADWVPTAP